MTLVAHVFFAAECSTIRHELDRYPLAFDTKNRSDVVAVIPNTLTT